MQLCFCPNLNLNYFKFFANHAAIISTLQIMSKRVLAKRAPKNIPPQLDINSESFDAEKFLHSDTVYLPFPNAKIYNNIAEYRTFTFLKKSDREGNRGKKEAIRERNFALYYSTLGNDPSKGNEYYTKLYRQQNKIKRRAGKKPASTSTVVCDNLRTNRIVKLKSKYKLYCQRKFKKWKREISSTQGNVADSEPSPSVGDVWTSTTNYAKEFINPNVVDDFSASTTTSLGCFLGNLLEASDLGNSTLLPVEKADQSHDLLSSSNRNVLLKFDSTTDPLKFLKCILFGKVEKTNQLPLFKSKNLMTGKIMSIVKNQTVSLMPSHNITVSVGASNLLRIHMEPIADIRNDNSAYETESSGYMSDCSEVVPLDEESLRSTKQKAISKNCDLNLMQTIIKSKNTEKFISQTDMSYVRSASRCKDSGKAQYKESIGENTGCKESVKIAKKQSIIVKIDRKYLKIGICKHELSTKKCAVIENRPPNGCVCGIKSSDELTYHCSCGFYKKAMSEIRKFKIPRKK